MSAPSAERIERVLERTSALLAGALLVMNVCDILLGIFCRYVLHASIIWTEEAARYCLVWLVLLGAGSACRRGDHMSIDFLLPHLPRAVQEALGALRLAIVLFVLALLVFFGTKNLAGTWEMKTMALGVPKALPLLALPVGMGMLFVQYALAAFIGRKEGSP